MDITKKVAKMSFIYHSNMLDVCNIANQLGILKDDKAEKVMKHHTMQCFDCIDRMGYSESNCKKYISEQAP